MTGQGARRTRAAGERQRRLAARSPVQRYPATMKAASHSRRICTYFRNLSRREFSFDLTDHGRRPMTEQMSGQPRQPVEIFSGSRVVHGLRLQTAAHPRTAPATPRCRSPIWPSAGAGLPTLAPMTALRAHPTRLAPARMTMISAEPATRHEQLLEPCVTIQPGRLAPVVSG